MKISALNPEHLKRYRDVARLLIRHGSFDLIRAAIDPSIIDADWVERSAKTSDPGLLADDLEDLGPTYVKIGQLLSSRADLLPPAYLDALGRLQDSVEPFPFEEVESIVRDELGHEVGAAFASFDETPIASASIGQVHRATLRNARVVAVKVQRPGIRETMTRDLAAFAEIAQLLDEHTDVGRRYAFSEMMETFEQTLLRELDYRSEAQSLARMAEGLSRHEHLVVPRPVKRLTSTRVLTMDFVEGTKISEISDVAGTDFAGRIVAEQLCQAYLEQMLVDGFFHADPHPGNVLLCPDGRLALIDLGMTSRLSPAFRRSLLQLVMAISDGDSTAVAEICLGLGTRLEDYDGAGFERRITHLVGRRLDASPQDFPFGQLVFELGRAAAESGLRPPADLAIVGKTMMHLDQVGTLLDESFDADAAMRRHLRRIAMRELLSTATPGQAIRAAFEVHQFARDLPRRLNSVLESLTERELEVRVRALDESSFLESLHRVGTRLTLGLILAALIIGAALAMTVDARHTLFGYPALAVVLFLAAVAGGIGLTVSIFVQDVWRKR